MLDTIASMTIPILVLLVLGSLILGLAWWLVTEAEGKDEWLTGTEDE